MNHWSRSAWTDAGQIMALIDPDAVPGEASGRPLHEWYGRLVEGDDLAGATDFIAHALPRYDCIVWAARAAIAAGAIDRSDPLVVSVLQWIDNPDDALRRRANALAAEVRTDTPAKLLCLAVFLSGGSLAPEDLPAIQPPEGVAAKLASTALLLGALRLPEPAMAMRQILDLGEAMVTGR